MILTANNQPVASGYLALPRTGRSVAFFRLAVPQGEAPITGGQTVTLKWQNGQRRIMHCIYAGGDGAVWRINLVGGNGGLSKEVAAKSFWGVPASVVLRDLLDESGEAAGPLEVVEFLPRWTRLRRAAHYELETLAQHAGFDWRIRADGTVWAGRDAFPEHPEVLEALVSEPARRYALFSLQPDLEPAITLRARMGGVEQLLGRVMGVRHVIGPQLRTEVWCE